jgi:primase-polymerase (primpol)-like protein
MYKTQIQHGTQALEELSQYIQWVIWEYDRERKKIPISPHNWGPASSTNPATWGSYEHALEGAGRHKQVGFVVTSEDEYCGIDLDNCVHDGEVAAWAWEIVQRFDSFTQVTPSNRGLRIWIKGRKPGANCKKKLENGTVELYERDRFFTFTDSVFHGDSIEARQEELERFYKELWPTQDNPSGINTVVVEGGAVYSGDDASLLQR